MVRLAVKPSLRPPSCWSLLVVKGGGRGCGGVPSCLLWRRYRIFLEVGEDRLGLVVVLDAELFLVPLDELGLELGRQLSFEERREGPEPSGTKALISSSRSQIRRRATRTGRGRRKAPRRTFFQRMGLGSGSPRAGRARAGLLGVHLVHVDLCRGVQWPGGSPSW